LLIMAMWHCSVKWSSHPIRDGSRIYPQIPANHERIASAWGAWGIQTLYMTGQNAKWTEKHPRQQAGARLCSRL
jgi:hypothetical protein